MYLEIVTRIRLVASPAAHSFLVRNTTERFVEFHAEALGKHLFDRAFGYLHDVLAPLDVRHLEVNLRKLGLTVCSQILVAEATGYLIVPVHARDHQKLFVYLRRLRQSVKFSVVDTTGNEIVARAFGRGFAEERGLYLKESVVGKVIAQSPRNLVSHYENVLKRLTAQVEIAVFEAQSFSDFCVFRYYERGRFRLRQYLDIVRKYLDFTRGHIRVDVSSAASDDAACAYHKLVSDRRCLFENRLVHVVVESDLDYARPVSDVDEHQVAEIAVFRDEAHDRNAAAYVACPVFSAHFSAFCTIKKVYHLLLLRCRILY